MKILTVVGARPQFIKAAVVSRAIADHNRAQPDKTVSEVLVHTGQHYDEGMSEVFFREMRIPDPQYNLGIGSGPHGKMTGRMLESLEEVIQAEKPNLVLVYGDTNSTLAGAIAAAKLQVPVAHVEAGLRSHNRTMPEEQNRVLTDHLAAWLFCPTKTAVYNLQHEGIREKGDSFPQIYHSGDVMYDAVLFYGKLAKLSKKTADLLGLGKQGYYLATVHRAENTDNPGNLSRILQALDEIAQRIPVILPLHPRTRKVVLSAGIVLKHLKLLEPLGYLEMLALLSGCRGVFTDSGGLQKEAYFCGKPCVTLREETEWTELVSLGCNCLTGAVPRRIKAAEQRIIQMSVKPVGGLFGDGNAGVRIIQTLVDFGMKNT